MTIDSGWVKILKTNAKRAFTEHLPVVPGTVFVDGQIKLMKGEHVKTWARFIEQQFFHTLDKCFQLGAHTVVLGFDNYQHVPRAKNMTQRKRSQHVPDFKFSDHDELPTILPDYWDAAMRNRSFKVKVMAMVCEQVRTQYRLKAHQTLILDFTDQIEVLGQSRPLPAVLNTEAPLKRGECDIKAFAFMGTDPLLISSTDGDYVPLSLLQIENALLANQPAPRIILFRIRTRGQGEEVSSKRKQSREMEYVDMNLIYKFVQQDLKVERPALCIAAMIACTGCDFTMNLPQLGPSRIWMHRHALKGAFESDRISPEGVMGLLIRAYTELFLNKVRVERCRARLSVGDAVVRYAELSGALKS